MGHQVPDMTFASRPAIGSDASIGRSTGCASVGRSSGSRSGRRSGTLVYEKSSAQSLQPNEARNRLHIRSAWRGQPRAVDARDRGIRPARAQALFAGGGPLKIATFNINNVNKRLDNLLAWLMASRPDVVCLQELKADHDAFPEAALEEAGYGAVWWGQRSWNGVAILARGATPVLTRRSLPGDEDDEQARYIEAAVNGVLIASIYLPNGNPQPGPKFAYKLAWFERLIDHAAGLLQAGVPVVLAGDYNVVPTAADIWPGHHEQANALLRPEARAAYRRLLEQGWTDALRTLQPDGPLWTFWGYLRHRWPNDKGMRLDHLLLSPNLADRLIAGGVERAVRGEEAASDHAPAWIQLDDLSPAKRTRTRRAR
jgi:exodeoxyribonuclease-3